MKVSSPRSHGFLFTGIAVSESPDTGVTEAGILRGNAKKKVSPYASPIHQKDFSGLPPAYTFVGNGEPVDAETLEYVRKLKEAGVEAEADVYPSDMHAFDMLDPESEVSRRAIRTFEGKFDKALTEMWS